MLIVDSMVNNVTVDLLMPGPKSGLTSLRLSPGGMGFFPRPGTLLNSPLSQLHYATLSLCRRISKHICKLEKQKDWLP